MSAPIKLHRCVFIVNGDSFMTELSSDLAWVRHGSVPRMEYFVSRVGLPYSYGAKEFARTYNPQPSTPMLDEIWRMTESYVGTTFDVCFLNRYLNQSDHLGWHADDSPEMDDARPIAIVSLGADREIWFRRKPGPDDLVVNGNEMETFGPPKIEKLLLGHGSVCVMAAGMQDTHQHRIPKSGGLCGERISLTFRGYTPVR